MPRARRPHAYFEVTEDPPLPMPALRRTGMRPSDNPISKNFFFIDFAEERTLRKLAKLPHSNYTVEDALEIEKFGNNVITNLEDSSAEASQLVKYQEQRKMLMEKKQAIRSKVKATLEQSRHKMRSHSTLAAKHSLLEQYNVLASPSSSRVDVGLEDWERKWTQKEAKVLAKLGLRRWE